MRHIVTLSLVFFSLAHLAKAERVEGLRLVAEKYCNKQQSAAYEVAARAERSGDAHTYPFFLSYSALSTIGIQPTLRLLKYTHRNSIVADLTIRAKPKNNSP
ncbi:MULTISPECIES: hypothetical protein [Pedobacter]|uniref:hypothetical protein n=1 Tax=Pedobacter TaxID=84567 RepID=UPI00210A3526|nr:MULTISPECIES: hypothetical protein [unclassified Pedobacter]